MQNDRYLSVKQASEGLYKEKGSKFIGLCYPIHSDKDVKPLTDQLRKEHPNAVHFCYAFRIGPEGKQFRANDDGEPSGTAGKPILNQLLSYKVTNTLLVVVRYFGGTKLGVSGLIQAYKEAANEALNNAVIEEDTLCDWYSLTFGYEQTGDINRLLRERKIEPREKKFEQGCFYLISVPVSESAGFTAVFEGMKNVEVSWLYQA